MKNKKEIPRPIEFSLRDTICVQLGTVIEAENTFSSASLLQMPLLAEVAVNLQGY